jgi:PST family polysaccharide transporter
VAEVRQHSFVKGAAILGLAAFLSKILGAVYKIPYQNITGNEGMYVYQQVYPLYSTLLILATAGFPIAISKLVSERLAVGDTAGARQVFRVAAVTLHLAGTLFFLLLFFGAGQVAEWMGNRAMLTVPIRAVSLALLVVPIVSAVRGWFQGMQNMVPTAVSQVIEQLIRVMTILLFSWYMIESGFGIVYAGAGAVFGAFTGAIGALAVLLVYWRRNSWSAVRPLRSGTRKRQPWSKTMKAILALSLPICLGSLVMPLYSLVDSFTVANLLVKSGWNLQEAIEGKGIFDRGQPLIQFASVFASALSLSVVPAIAEARARGEWDEAREKAVLALRLTWLIGLPASVGLAVIAAPVNVMLYKDALGSDVLAILAFTTLFSTLKLTSSGILQGESKVYRPALHLVLGVLTKAGLNILLIPPLGLKGAALSTVAAYAVAAGLNLWALRSHYGGKWYHDGMWGRSLAASGWMAGAVFAVMNGLELLFAERLEVRAMMTVVSFTSVATGALVYGWALVRLGLITRNDLEKVPKLRRKLLPLLDRWGRVSKREESSQF